MTYTLRETLRLGFPEHFFLRNLTSASFDELAFFNRLSAVYDPILVSFIIKIANANSAFESLCKKTDYNGLWGKQYASIGYWLTSDREIAVNLLEHRLNNFDLLRGAFFFNESKKVQQALGRDFAPAELLFLKKAMEYQSIHATQRYCHYTYMQMESGELGSEESRALLNEVIGLCRKQQKSYGSYANMMLAEACFRYAQWAKQQGEPSEVIDMIHTGVSACERATASLEKWPAETLRAIHNASLGSGLGSSNTFKIADPLEAKKLLVDWLEENSASRAVVSTT